MPKLNLMCFVCVACIVHVFLSLPAQAEQALRPLTSGEGPATLKSCTPQALGQNPHPALLAACLYLPFSGKAEVWEVQDKPNRLLARYATFEFNDLLEKNYKWAMQGRGGILTFGIFFRMKELATLRSPARLLKRKAGLPLFQL